MTNKIEQIQESERELLYRLMNDISGVAAPFTIVDFRGKNEYNILNHTIDGEFRCG